MLNFQIILLLRNAHRRKTEGQKVKEDYKELVFNFLVMWVCVCVCVWRLSSVHAPAAKRKKNSIFFLVQHHLLCTFPAARHMASIRFPSLFALYGTQQVELQKKKKEQTREEKKYTTILQKYILLKLSNSTLFYASAERQFNAKRDPLKKTNISTWLSYLSRSIITITSREKNRRVIYILPPSSFENCAFLLKFASDGELVASLRFFISFFFFTLHYFSPVAIAMGSRRAAMLLRTSSTVRSALIIEYTPLLL